MAPQVKDLMFEHDGRICVLVDDSVFSASPQRSGKGVVCEVLWGNPSQLYVGRCDNKGTPLYIFPDRLLPPPKSKR